MSEIFNQISANVCKKVATRIIFQPLDKDTCHKHFGVFTVLVNEVWAELK
jgi:hypothetical protein